MGQLAVNRPIHQIQDETGIYCFATDENDQAVFKDRAFLKSIGVSSTVAARFSNVIDPYLATKMKLTNEGSVARSKFFANTYNFGSGSIAWVPDFSPSLGWKNLAPISAIPFNL